MAGSLFFKDCTCYIVTISIYWFFLVILRVAWTTSASVITTPDSAKIDGETTSYTLSKGHTIGMYNFGVEG